MLNTFFTTRFFYLFKNDIIKLLFIYFIYFFILTVQFHENNERIVAIIIFNFKIFIDAMFLSFYMHILYNNIIYVT